MAGASPTIATSYFRFRVRHRGRLTTVPVIRSLSLRTLSLERLARLRGAPLARETRRRLVPPVQRRPSILSRFFVRLGHCLATAGGGTRFRPFVAPFFRQPRGSEALSLHVGDSLPGPLCQSLRQFLPTLRRFDLAPVARREIALLIRLHESFSFTPPGASQRALG